MIENMRFNTQKIPKFSAVSLLEKKSFLIYHHRNLVALILNFSPINLVNMQYKKKFNIVYHDETESIF